MFASIVNTFKTLSFEATIGLGIVTLLVALIFTLLLALIYSGLFKRIDVSAGSSPLGSVTIAYKYHQGPYSGAGSHFTNVAVLAPNCRCIGIYYDNPKSMPEERLRFIVGVILTDEPTATQNTLRDKLLVQGYKMMKIPNVSYAVRSEFPYRTFLSVYIAISRVYPMLAEFIKFHNLCAHPFLEIYNPDTILFLAPLAKQEEFYVKEISANTNTSLSASGMGSNDSTHSIETTVAATRSCKPQPSMSCVSDATDATEVSMSRTLGMATSEDTSSPFSHDTSSPFTQDSPPNISNTNILLTVPTAGSTTYTHTTGSTHDETGLQIPHDETGSGSESQTVTGSETASGSHTGTGSQQTGTGSQQTGTGSQQTGTGSLTGSQSGSESSSFDELHDVDVEG